MAKKAKPGYPWSRLDDHDVEEYLRTIARHGHRDLGSAAKGEIQILAATPEETRAALHVVRERVFHRLVASGQKSSMAAALTRAETLIGPVFKDRFMGIFRDLCLFPSGFIGTYECHSWNKTVGSSGICVAPITELRRLVLSDAFRHPVRTRTLEFPRGGFLSGETIVIDRDGNPGSLPVLTVAGEVREETGYEADTTTIEHLGIVDPNTGLSSQAVHLLAVSAKPYGPPQPEATEAIYGAVELTADELGAALLRGYYEYPKGARYAGTRVQTRGAPELTMLQMLQLHGLVP